MGEVALVGLQQKASSVFGSYDLHHHYVPSPAGDTEGDFEQDLFGAVRVLDRGQVALLVPFVETRRATPQLGPQVGRGVGDVNASARWDFRYGASPGWLPGIALLAGVTFPTGRPVSDATPPQFADATGTGAVQINGALALEKTTGPWLLNLTGIVAKRMEHGGETLGTQFTFLAAGAYTFTDDTALAVSLSYAFEGDASAGGASVPYSAHAVTTATVSGLWLLNDTWRLLAGVYASPPIDGAGNNQPAAGGVTLTLVHAWD